MSAARREGGSASGASRISASATGSAGGACATELSVTLALTSMRCPQRRHFMRTILPATRSSPIWYFALQLSQMNFIGAHASG
jgi:hypothetical protein